MKKSILFALLIFLSILILPACKNKNKTTKVNLDGYYLIWRKESYPELPDGLLDYYAGWKGHWILEVADTYWCEIELDNFESDQITTNYCGEYHLVTTGQASGVYLRASDGISKVTKAYCNTKGGY